MTDNQDPVDPQEYLRRLQESADQASPPNVYPADPYQTAPHPTTSYPTAGYPAMPPPEHPSATTAMVLGIIGLASITVLCGIGLFLSPVAWAMGAKAVKEIDAGRGRFSGRDKANAGKIMGIIGTVLLILGLLALVAVIALMLAAPVSSYESSYDTTYESDF